MLFRFEFCINWDRYRVSYVFIDPILHSSQIPYFGPNIVLGGAAPGLKVGLLGLFFFKEVQEARISKRPRIPTVK